MKSLRHIYRYMSPYKKWALIAPILVIVAVFAELMQPAIMRRMVDIGVAQQDMPYILRNGGVLILLAFIGAFGGIISAYYASKASMSMARDLRRDLFVKIQSLSFPNIDELETGQLITRLTNDVTQVQMVVMLIVRMVFYAPILGVGGVIRAVGKGGSMWWIIAVAVMVLIGLVVIVISIALPKFKIIQKLIDRINLVSRENLSGMMVIRAFNMQAFEEDRFDKANLDLTAVSLFINRLMVIMMPLMMLIMNGLSMAIIWVGAHQVAEANMQVGDMMAFIQYAMQIVMSFLMLTMLFIFLQHMYDFFSFIHFLHRSL